MTEIQHADGSLNLAVAQLDELCAKVGLQQAGLPVAAGEYAVPAGTTLWTSRYARLVLWPCGSSDATGVTAAAREGQGWFDEILVRGEAQSRGPIDGYLVLALPSAPTADASEDARRLELSSQVCRKHLIWPAGEADIEENAGTWLRVADVTVVGLPDTMPSGGGELVWPKIDSEAQAVWDDLAALGMSATLLQDETL
ncbi:hypothetical protein [Brucella pituitosa]|uniref:hypothetical protein n=1 Tax=Brucella pituitosa TaxID=571256 RepID=UPI000D008AF6|nr:hypothetical protein CQ062_20105 [Ochrobactrum sp. MYb68]